MKKFLSFAFCFVLGWVIASSCTSKKVGEQSLEQQLPDITKEYVRSEMKMSKVDSVSIFSVDTINKYRYASAALGFLQQSESNLEAQCAEAVAAGDSITAKNCRKTLADVSKTCDYYADCMAKYAENDPKILFYYVCAYYYVRGNEHGIMYFLTPDLQIYTFDPMDTSVLN